MSSNPFAAYQETKVLSASPVELIHLAYEGAIEAIGEARNHLAGQRIHERARAITRVQLILTELQSSLDFNKGGDVSLRLGRLYDYMQRRLTEANFKQIEEPLAEVQSLLETLGSAWKEIAATGTAVPVSTTLGPSPIAPSSFNYSQGLDSTYGDNGPIYGRAESAY